MNTLRIPPPRGLTKSLAASNNAAPLADICFDSPAYHGLVLKLRCEAGVMRLTVRGTGKRIRLAPAWDGLAQLAVLGVCFGLGALGGFFFSSWSGDSPELSEYLLRYFQMAGQGSGIEPPLWSAVWDLVRWPLAALLLGSTALGAVGVPILMSVRGFLLSYAAAVLGRLFGLPGMAASLAAFGVTAFVAVPVLFVAAFDAFRQSLNRLSGERPPGWNLRAQALAPCAGLLVLAAALQQTVMPALFTAVCARLFIK